MPDDQDYKPKNELQNVEKLEDAKKQQEDIIKKSRDANLKEIARLYVKILNLQIDKEKYKFAARSKENNEEEKTEATGFILLNTAMIEILNGHLQAASKNAASKNGKKLKVPSDTELDKLAPIYARAIGIQMKLQQLIDPLLKDLKNKGLHTVEVYKKSPKGSFLIFLLEMKSLNKAFIHFIATSDISLMKKIPQTFSPDYDDQELHRYFEDYRKAIDIVIKPRQGMKGANPASWKSALSTARIQDNLPWGTSPELRFKNAYEAFDKVLGKYLDQEKAAPEKPTRPPRRPPEEVLEFIRDSNQNASNNEPAAEPPQKKRIQGGSGP